jgi:hypothetical protein
VPTEVRRSADRFTTERPGSRTRYCFSFGPHYDPDNVSFGPVVAVNDETVLVGGGFAPHRHAGLVIVTYVVSGSLAHQGISTAVVPAGALAVLRCGGGVEHSEVNAGDEELRFVQTWLTTSSDEVSYSVVEGSVRVDTATVTAGRLPAQEFTGHVFVATGTARVGEELLSAGDSVRAPSPLTVAPEAGSELVLVSF